MLAGCLFEGSSGLSRRLADGPLFVIPHQINAISLPWGDQWVVSFGLWN